MKGKKLIFAVILSLIVCLVLIPTCAYASEIPGDTPPQEESDLQPQNQQQGNLDEGKTDEGTTDEGNLDEGNINEGNLDEGKTDEGTTNEGNLDEGKTDEGNLDEGKTDEGTTNEGNLDEGTTDEGNPDEGKTDEGSTNEGNTDEGQSPEILQPTKKPGYQVEFTYNDKTVIKDGLLGGEQLDLNEILTELGFTTGATQAKGNADDLFSVADGENGLVVVSHKAFTTEHDLVVVVGGVEYTIKVTDDGAVIDVNNKANLESEANAAGNGQVIHLTEDLDLDTVTGDKWVALGSDDDSAEREIIIDLGGHTIKRANGLSAFYIKGNSTYTLRNGTVIGKFGIDGNAVVNLEKGLTIEGIVVLQGSSSVNIYGEVDATNYYYKGDTFAAVSTNGSKGYEGTSIVIHDGAEITHGKDVAVYLPNGTLTVKGGTITGTTGIYVKGGKLTLNGGTVIGNGAAASYNPLTEGCQSTGDAIVVEYNAAGYNPIDGLYLSNGTVSSANGKALGVYKGNSTDPNKQNDDKNPEVNGGVYSDDSVEDYIDKNEVIIGTSGDKYLVGEDVVNALLAGETIELTNYPEQFDNVTLPIEFPDGATVINKTGRDIIILGIPLKNGESMTIVAPTATTGEVLFAKYYVVDGKGQEWTKGSADGLKFELNSDKVVKVLIDGVEVEFTVENGEIVIAAEVLEALEAGEHEIEFVFDDGSCKTEFIIK